MTAVLPLIATEKPKSSPFAPSLAAFFPTDEAAVRGVISYANGQPASVDLQPVAYHRSAYGDRNKLVNGPNCGYWASPRGTIDHTGIVLPRGGSSRRIPRRCLARAVWDGRDARDDVLR